MTNLLREYGNPDLYLDSFRRNSGRIESFINDLDLWVYWVIACNECGIEGSMESIPDLICSIASPEDAHRLCESFFVSIRYVPERTSHLFYKDLCSMIFMWESWKWIDENFEHDEVQG